MKSMQFGMRSTLALAVAFAFAMTMHAHPAYAASLSLSSGSADVSVGDIVTVRLSLGSSDQAINTAEGTIDFSPDVLEAVSIDKSTSIFPIWVEDPSFSNAAGEVTFSGGLPTPGFQGSNGTVLKVTFRATHSGVASLSVNDATVRANDGLGTDVLQSSGTFQMTIKDAPSATPVAAAASAPASNPTTTAIAPAPVMGAVISSATNPDQSQWYSNSAPEFTWTLPAGALAVETGISKSATDAPVVTYTPAISSKTVTDMTDGTYYFALQVQTAGGWSDTSRYTVNIDTHAPSPFQVTVLPSDSANGLQAKFSTTDNQSGVDHYDLLVNGSKVGSVTAAQAQGPVVIPPTAAGTSSLTVIAYDKAGNSTSASVSFMAVGSANESGSASNPMTLSFSIPIGGLVAVGRTLINYLVVILIVVSIIGGNLFVAWFIWQRVEKWRRTYMRRVTASGRVLNAEIIELHKALRDEVDHLQIEGNARELTSEEKHLLERFSKLTEKTEDEVLQTRIEETKATDQSGAAEEVVARRIS